MPALRAIGGAIGRAARAATGAVDARDVCLGVGLAMVGCGLGMVFVPAGLVVPGAVLVYVAVFRSGPRPNDDGGE